MRQNPVNYSILPKSTTYVLQVGLWIKVSGYRVKLLGTIWALGINGINKWYKDYAHPQDSSVVYTFLHRPRFLYDVSWQWRGSQRPRSLPRSALGDAAV